MSELALRSTDKAPTPASTRPMGEGVSREEVERRLFFVVEKMLDGLSRRVLVTMCMELFGVGRRMAQKYVVKAERRLRDQAVRENPLFYLQLSKMQRDKLLESVLHHTNHPQQLEPKLLAELVTAANRVLDSRDRAALLLFRSQADSPPPRVEMSVETVEEETGLLRGDQNHQPLEPSPEPAEQQEPEAGAESAFDDIPPETMERLIRHITRGCSPAEAVQKVLVEDRARAEERKRLSQQHLQPN